MDAFTTWISYETQLKEYKDFLACFIKVRTKNRVFHAFNWLTSRVSGPRAATYSPWLVGYEHGGVKNESAAELYLCAMWNEKKRGDTRSIMAYFSLLNIVCITSSNPQIIIFHRYGQTHLGRTRRFLPGSVAFGSHISFLHLSILSDS